MSFDSAEYWRKRYQSGGNSGAGSYGALADFKAASLNSFIESHHISSAVEYGSGDGNQLSLLHVPQYLGLDVSQVAIDNLQVKFAGDLSKAFVAYDPDDFDADISVRRDIAISMDVILHLTEDIRYEKYMRNLIASADRFVGIFNTATEIQLEKMAQHNRYRDHRIWISSHAPEFREFKVDFAPAELGYPEHTGFFFYERV
jgi:hypothetical protein